MKTDKPVKGKNKATPPAFLFGKGIAKKPKAGGTAATKKPKC